MFNVPILIGGLGRNKTSRGGDPLAASIRAALVNYWEFEENDSTHLFLDGSGGQSLTVRDTSGVATTSSKTVNTLPLVGRNWYPAAANQETSYIPASAAFKLPDADWTYGAWMSGAAGSVGGSTRWLMGNIGSSATDWQAEIAISASDDKILLEVSANGSAISATISSGLQLSQTKWTLLTATLDRSNNKIILRHRVSDAGALTSVNTTFSSALYTGSTTANFCINAGLSSDTTYFSGARSWLEHVDCAFYLTKAISDAEFDYLFNGGSGRSYANILAG